MANKPKSYLLVYLLISSGFLFAVNFYMDFAITRFTEYLKITLLIFFILTFISTTIYLIKKTGNTFRGSLAITAIFFLFNTVLVAEVIAFEIHVAKLSKIERKLETCEKAENQFKTDLASGNLKYFTFGIGEDEEFTEKLESDYGLEVYHMYHVS